MPRPARRTNRDCELRCRTCGEWKHFSRFRTIKARVGTDSRYQPDCKDCETKLRNEAKNTDRPRAIIENRARGWATKLGCSRDFLMVNLNWRALVPILRAMMTDEGLCLSCGHPFTDAGPDIQLEHRIPPRSKQDWARHHARNLWLGCRSCNTAKGSTPYAKWLDDMEAHRLSVTAINGQRSGAYEQGLLFP